VQQQVNIGPRVPNTPEHTITGDFLVDALENFGGKVQEQKFEALTFDGVNLSLRNIIASFNPEAVKRILLAAHWDTRPYADKDIIEPNIPIDGANDGASGVGVLLEIARNISIVQPNVGIDIVLFDGEDWGEYHDAVNVPKPKGFDTWWALGSQYWSKNNGNYRAYYGILLDMVGARGSQFHMEGISMNYAPKIVKKVWDKASEIGYGNYFIHQNQHEITDDHFFVNRDAKIPMIDIVHYDPAVGYFGDYHHTHRDNMELIDKRTLKAVGQTLLQVIYNE
jgi:Zn-dependent M28 family amino/carboxypeptidase